MEVMIGTSKHAGEVHMDVHDLGKHMDVQIGRGSRFDSGLQLQNAPVARKDERFSCKEDLVSSILTRSSNETVAEWIRHWLPKPDQAGSIPASLSNADVA